MALQTASQVLPVGFGRGRRSNTIAVLETDTVAWAEVTPTVEQWGLDEGLSDWQLCSASGFLTGTVQAGFDLVWRFWKRGESADDVVPSLLDHDAVIVPAPCDEDLPVVSALLEAGVPVVLAYSRVSDERVCWVACDNRGGVAQAVRHLRRLGHTRIGYIGGPRNVTDFREREHGYREAMANAGLSVNPALVTGTGLNRDESEIKAAAARVLHGEDRPSAVVCATDPLAVGVMDQARELGLRVPGDVAVTGFDDMPDAIEVIPHVTSIRQPTLEVANHACYLAACCVLGQEPVFGAWQLELPTTLVIRESCGAAVGLGIASSDVASGEAGPQAVRQELEWRMRQLVGMNQEMQELLYVASHDLRAPLVTIQGFASALQRKYGDLLDHRGQQYLERIGRSVDSMRGLIDSLLTLSRAHNRALELKPVQVREVVTRAVSDLKAMISEKGARVRVSRRMPTVLVDEVALYQVFLNLLSNALRYLGDQPAPLVSVSHRTDPDDYEFTVQDNGVGIAPDHHDEVFQAFRRLGQVETEGAGIGLTTVKRIILRHGGRVWVDSQLGHGAAFRFTLPRREVNYGEDGDHQGGAQRDPHHRG
jgi:signal transduction histidine kinase